MSTSLEHWRSLWDDAYSERTADPLLNLAGWKSSTTGQPIPEAEMRDWVERTVERVRGLAPRRVLELGSGTGMLLLRLAPVVEHYTGVDFSPRALAFVAEQSKASGLENVRLLEGRADAPPLEPEDRFDTLILNSVAQYFPDRAYLARVLETALAHLEPGGRLFLGDLRSRALLPAFHASVASLQAEPDVPLAELRSLVERRVAVEPELTLNPQDLLELTASWARPVVLEHQVKRGRKRNELTRFRWDAVLKLEATPTEEPSETIEWSPGLTSAGIRARLAASPGASIALVGLPNARLTEPLTTLRWLAEPPEGCETAGDLLAALRRSRSVAVEPEDLWGALSASDPRRMVVSWLSDGGDGLLRAEVRH